MRLSELKAIVDRATERATKFGVDPLVVTVDFRSRKERENDIEHRHEELRHVREADIIEFRSLEPNCSDLHYYTVEGMFANHPMFYLTADDTQGIL